MLAFNAKFAKYIIKLINYNRFLLLAKKESIITIN